MVKQIKKRDGRLVPFNSEKITTAIWKAMKSCGTENLEVANLVADYVANLDNETMEIEEVQDIVIAMLITNGCRDVAREYSNYRNQRTRIRESNTNLIKEIRDKIRAANVENQNANVDEKSFGGRLGSVTSSVMKKYALDYCMSEMARNNHLNNMIYIHDLDHYAVGDHNCLSIPFDKLLKKDSKPDRQMFVLLSL